MQLQQQATHQLNTNNNSSGLDNLANQKHLCRRQEQPNILERHPDVDKCKQNQDECKQNVHKPRYEYKTISYLLGSMSQIPTYLLRAPSKYQNRVKSPENDQMSATEIERPQLLKLEGIQAQVSGTEISQRKRINSDMRINTSINHLNLRPRVISQEYSPVKIQEQTSFESIGGLSTEEIQNGQNGNSTNESESSTVSSSDQKESVGNSAEQMEEFKTLVKILNHQILGKDSNAGKKENSILVESFSIGLGGKQEMIDQIPCVSSADQTQFIVFFNKLDIESFQKSTLFNLVQSARSVSNECKTIVFISARGDTQSVDSVSKNYKAFKEMFEVIGAKRMLKSSIKSLTQSDDVKEFGQILENYGFYKMEI